MLAFGRGYASDCDVADTKTWTGIPADAFECLRSVSIATSVPAVLGFQRLPAGLPPGSGIRPGTHGPFGTGGWGVTTLNVEPAIAHDRDEGSMERTRP